MATAPTTPNVAKAIAEAVETQIRKEVNEVFDREKERIINELETKRDEVVAKAALKITKYIEIQNHTDRLIISLDLREIK